MAGKLEVTKDGSNGRDRDRTDDLYRVKVALIPTELRARENRFYNLLPPKGAAFFPRCGHDL